MRNLRPFIFFYNNAMFYVNISLAFANKRKNSVIINNLKKQLTVLIQREERHALLQYVHVIFNDTIIAFDLLKKARQ